MTLPQPNSIQTSPESKNPHGAIVGEQRLQEPVLFLAGFCLILLQFFMIREITALLRGTEIVIFLVAVAYFFGYSVGYGLAGKLSWRNVQYMALAFWILHLTLPFSLRYVTGSFAETVPGLPFFVLLFFTAFVLSSFFTLLLPRYIDLSEHGSHSLARLYSIELAGAAFGIGCIFAFGSVVWFQPVLYQAALAVIVAILWNRRYFYGVAGLALAVYCFAFMPLERHSIEYLYAHIHSRSLKNPVSLYSVNSPYQKVDFLRSQSGRRYIFLNGNKNFGSKSLKLFNTFLSRAPLALFRPKDVLIIGAGSMESAGHAVAVADHVDIVELDPAVPYGSRKFLADINHLDDFSNWTLTIQDAKRYLGSTEKLYDLIIVDVPVPLTIQLGLLHSVEFYKLAKRRLKEKGVISVSLSGTFHTKNTTPRTVAAAVLEAFEEVYIYTPDIAKRSFALAGRSLPFTKKQLVKVSALLGTKRLRVFDRPKALPVIGNMPPMSTKDMSYPVKRSLRKIKRRFF